MKEIKPLNHIKRELADLGINPIEALNNDIFCLAYQQYKQEKLTLERLIEVAETLWN